MEEAVRYVGRHKLGTPSRERTDSGAPTYKRSMCSQVYCPTYVATPRQRRRVSALYEMSTSEPRDAHRKRIALCGSPDTSALL